MALSNLKKVHQKCELLGVDKTHGLLERADSVCVHYQGRGGVGTTT